MSVKVLVIIIIITLIIICTNKQIKELEKKNITRKEIYYKYLKSTKWLKKRNKALKRSGYKCQVCGYKKNLQVHHNTYEHIFHEHKQDLVVLCWKCHSTFHKK